MIITMERRSNRFMTRYIIGYSIFGGLAGLVFWIFPLLTMGGVIFMIGTWVYMEETK